jgi:ABC-type transport system involved in multi-copper enzyme maturation permease subunit
VNIDLEVPSATPVAPPPPPARPGAWRITWYGVRMVARLELRRRVRSTRWIVALVVWFVVIGAITLLATGALGANGADSSREERGAVLFAVVSFLVLGLGLLVTPTLTSTSINSDRNAGTLATLQVTLLSPAEIVLGKVAAAWLAACAFLVASVPYFLLALGLGGTPVRAAVAVLVLIAVLLAAVCGIGIGFSSLTARSAGSTMLTFATVAGLAVLTPILFGVTYPSIRAQQEVQVWSLPDTGWNGQGVPPCVWKTEVRTVAHTERTWWLLAANPFVVVADGSTVPSAETTGGPGSPFASLRDAVRLTREGAGQPLSECWGLAGPVSAGSSISTTTPSSAPIWPWGLALNVLLGVGGVWTAVRRLTIPERKLPRGTRVA